VIALIVFNLLFAVENGLDLTFLWSGARLPSGVTLAQYAHRGAYALMVTAVLAGGFALYFLREGSVTATTPSIRRLVGVWVAQNIVLCASSILRTLDYVEAYSLTRLRIAALLWMGLTTLGLALIGWRILKRKSRAWLINANMLALGAVLVVASSGDLGAVAAAWNLRHASDVGGSGADLDVCYLEMLGPSALLPILELEQRGVGPALRPRLVAVRRLALKDLQARQDDWRTWTWRGQRRLDAARAILHRSSGLDAAPSTFCSETYTLNLTSRTQP
jgi:hypothetical protein